jgi:hypothetical protein
MWKIRETLNIFASDYFKEKEHKFVDNPDPDDREKSGLIEVNPRTFDLHLSYSEGFHEGPIIQRTGDGSPFMEDPREPGSYTTDPDCQRVGTYYILDATQQRHSEWLFLAFAGNYVLFSQLPNRFKDESPLEFIEQLLHDFDPRLDTKDLIFALRQFANGVGNLSNSTVNMIGKCREFLHKNEGEEREGKVFRRKGLEFFPDYERKTTEIADRCFRIIDELYATEYPRPTVAGASPQGQPNEKSTVIRGFEQHSIQQAFRIKVESLVKKYLRLFLLSRSAWSHEERADEKLQEPTKAGSAKGEIVFMQGCGDLTMNMWNVAFVSGDSYHGLQKWELLHAPDEPLNDRKYTCLIKWKCSPDKLADIARNYRVVYPYQIASLGFKAPWLREREDPDRHVFLWEGNHCVPIGNLIEFAVYGKHIHCGGEPSDPLLLQRLRAIIHQFSDIRHVYRLPNLNPEKRFEEKDTQDKGIDEYRQKPRFLFNERTVDDMWLFERALIQGDRNLRVAALNQAIQFEKRELGAPEQWIEFVLEKEPEQPSARRYRKADHTKELDKTEWRWLKEGRHDWLEIYLQFNHFPCSMIGVTADDEEAGPLIAGEVVPTSRLFFLAHGHNYERFGCTLLDAAHYFATCGARNILILDEGGDVFQLAMLPANERKDRETIKLRTGSELTQTVPLKREQIRCVFWATERAVRLTMPKSGASN